MKKIIYSTLLLFLINSAVFGQAPNWTVNESNFQYTMSFVGFLNNDGNALISSNDKVAAFVNGECRGVTNLIYVASKNQYYAYLTVFSNDNNEIVNFKIYDSAFNVVKSIDKTMNFAINEHYGNLFQAYSFASPALKTDADILDFSFSGIVRKNILIEENKITVYLNKNQSIKALNAVFVPSLGATVYSGSTKQISGSSVFDFTNPIVFNLLSEDQSINKVWTIVVKNALADAIYYKKDAVCYEGGALKIMFPLENEKVELAKEGVVLSTQIITNGQVLFSNLNVGIYNVSVGGNFKEIIINLK